VQANFWWPWGAPRVRDRHAIAKANRPERNAVATKHDRLPDVDRCRIWSEEELEGLTAEDVVSWETLRAEDDEKGLSFECPSTRELVKVEKGQNLDRSTSAYSGRGIAHGRTKCAPPPSLDTQW
jgi:hypothetical protein